eukprot:gene5177-1695_t
MLDGGKFTATFLRVFVDATSDDEQLKAFIETHGQELPFPIRRAVETSVVDSDQRIVPAAQRWEAVALMTTGLQSAKCWDGNDHYDLLQLIRRSHNMLQYGTFSPLPTDKRIDAESPGYEKDIVQRWIPGNYDFRGAGNWVHKQRLVTIKNMEMQRRTPENWIARWVDDDFDVNYEMMGLKWIDNQRIREILDTWEEARRNGKVDYTKGAHFYGHQQTVRHFDKTCDEYQTPKKPQVSEYCLGMSFDGCKVNGCALGVVKKRLKHEHYMGSVDDTHTADLGTGEFRKAVDAAHDQYDKKHWDMFDRIVSKVEKSDIIRDMIGAKAHDKI